MNDPVVGVKAYGWEWANDFGMSMADAAARMRDQGINTVLAQNLIDPLPASAVDQAPPLTGYDDYQWTQLLRENDLTVYQTTAFFFDPEEYAAHPELRGIDQWGRQAEPFDWYRGINPTDPDYLERKIDKVCRAVETTKPDGLFLSFYDPGRRKREITAEDWLRALQGVDLSGADGVLIYSWRDLLRDQAAGGERVRRLQQYAAGTLPQVGA